MRLGRATVPPAVPWRRLAAFISSRSIIEASAGAFASCKDRAKIAGVRVWRSAVMRAVAVGLLAGLASAQAAFAQAQKDWDDCISSEPERSLAGCTLIIDRGTETKVSLAIACLYDRAAIYDDKGDFDRAVVEYDKMLALRPDDGRALNGRAWAYAQKKELDKALADVERGTSRTRFTPAPGST